MSLSISKPAPNMDQECEGDITTVKCQVSGKIHRLFGLRPEGVLDILQQELPVPLAEKTTDLWQRQSKANEERRDDDSNPIICQPSFPASDFPKRLNE